MPYYTYLRILKLTIMKKLYSKEKPKMVIRSLPKIIINYGIYELADDELKLLWEELGRKGDVESWFAEEHRYGYYQVTLPVVQFTYGGIINAIISDAYKPDVMEATINNYLLDPTDEENKKYFNEMQDWRKYAKSIAREILNI